MSIKNLKNIFRFPKRRSTDPTDEELHESEYGNDYGNENEKALDYSELYPDENTETTPKEKSSEKSRSTRSLSFKIDEKSRSLRSLSFNSHDLGSNPSYDESDRKFSESNIQNPSFPSYREYDRRQDGLEEGIPPIVVMAYKCGFNTEHVQCNVVRTKGLGLGAISYTNYELRLESTNELLMIAKKMNISRKGNFHFFDMTRGLIGETLSTKGGNYLGKLEYNMQGTEFILANSASDAEEVAGFMFDTDSSRDNMKEKDIKDIGQARRLLAVLPQNNPNGLSAPYKVADNHNVSMTHVMRNNFEADRPYYNLHKFESKKPVLVNGNLRLNFKGRVGIASVKNFQLTSVNDVDNIIVQFGKVDEDRFNLDFKAPFNAFQAFSLILSQFIL
mmetsp:Transcript_18093/g.17411  ORF Transcript_18093/g.17411 Transcript_18093/m.17411 type:complete len:389 (+) Transcript_18093:100-1266(+)|eukprot:CAMPEP_0119035140 /NCGR_PEP_ID=MMETSP1177-20130426/2102_1 /TAXON_ID=2985 /ORGANISM="Ochromonas sp, Strain CCMP1899" /LENGTH=388 /DNA_ID=CAMNT_0006993081 /DNA_START=82 /DNA_END=1248 /DNA_ORIENTATION=+